MKGFVDFYRADRGFGFIYDVEKTARYFTHATNVENGGILQTGLLVEFTPGLTSKGPVALNVRILDLPAEIAALLKAGAR